MDLLIIAPNNYEDIKAKGVLYQYEIFRENNFFERLLLLFPITRDDFQIKSGNSQFIQYGWKFKVNQLNRFKIIKLLGSFIILFKLLFFFPFIIKKMDITIIRASDPYYMGLLGLFYSKIFKIPLIISIHTDYDLCDGLGGQTFKLFGSRRLAKKLERFVYSQCDAIFPIREYLKIKIVNEFDIDSSKIEIFPHGINFKQFDMVNHIDIYELFNIDKNKKIISFIGRLSNENYIYEVLKIAKELFEKRDDFIVLLVGDGIEYDRIAKEIISEDINSVVKMLAFQEYDIVVNVRKYSYVSLCLMGGFSLIEACAASRPIISYDVEWHSELVKNNETGFLLKEFSIEAVVEKIIYLFDNPHMAKELGENARKLSFLNHDINHTTRMKQIKYKKVLNAK